MRPNGLGFKMKIMGVVLLTLVLSHQALWDLGGTCRWCFTDSVPKASQGPALKVALGFRV